MVSTSVSFVDLERWFFSVSPMNTSPDYVHPVAENFTDFLRLILACGDVAAVEQAWMWNEAQFEAFLNENPTTQEQQQTLSEISEKMNLLPMEQPWTYIKNLQSSFDYSQIKYTEDYYDNDMTSEAELVAPEWKVYFDGDFWGHRGKDRAGKEIKLDKQFDWAGYHWVIPAAYSCSKGLVVDFCMRVDSESIRDFMKKWNLDWENDSCENFTREQQMQMEWEKGHQLKHITGAGLDMYCMYNDSGKRIRKTVNGVTTDFYLDWFGHSDADVQ